MLSFTMMISLGNTSRKEHEEVLIYQFLVQKSYCYTPGVCVHMHNVRANVSHENLVFLYFSVHFNWPYILI